jgi:high-affinity Fe2+/Pb2+ permease
MTSNDSSYRPSTTNAQCKACTSPDRFEIEVALAQAQPQETVARRFSTGDQSFSRQNIHTHYHNHMEVIDRAVSEAAVSRMQHRILDLDTAIEIEEQNQRLRDRMREQIYEAIANNRVRINTRDVMAFIEQDARLSEQRSAATLESFMLDARAFKEAVQRCVPGSEWNQIVDTYDDLIQEHGGPSGLLFDE